VEFSLMQLDLLLGEANKADAMQRVWDHANDHWKHLAYDAVRQLARTRQWFTTDDVWQLLAASNAATREHRAMGPVMLRAAKAGLIAKTDRVLPTTRPSANCRPVAIWLSTSASATALLP
jgi:hypothetical protein